MEISGNSYNQPVNFYTKNTGNNINMAIDSENYPYQSNIFAPEFEAREKSKHITIPMKRKTKSKRLNTIDTDYLPDETENTSIKENSDNFFLEKEKSLFGNKFKRAFFFFVTSTPLINYFFLKERKQKIQKTVESLNNINQNVDELLNTAVPYGEEKSVYQDIAKNLTDAATILGKANKEL